MKSKASFPLILRITLFSWLLTPVAFAANSAWNLSPASGNWNTATNWTPAAVPDGPTSIGTFAVSNQTTVSLAFVLQLSGIVFNSGASAFTIDVTPKFTSTTIGGAGIINNSGITQNFVTDIDPARTQGLMVFSNSATAGSLTLFTNHGGKVSGNGGSATLFTGTSSADHGVFVNNGGAVSGAAGGFVGFSDSTTAGNGTFTAEGGVVSGASGGPVSFSGAATAGAGVFTIKGGAVGGASGALAKFFDTSSAGNATIIVNNGATGSIGAFIAMEDDSTGGTARLEAFGNGYLDISFHNAPGLTCGSVEGTGSVFLGAVNLTVGSNDLSTAILGVIQDGGQNGGTGGSLTKVGSGTLTLTKSNTYTGGTIVNEGVLLLRNTAGSGTGPGAVQVNGGTLSGNGIVAGPVTIGTGSGGGAFLAPASGTTKGIFTTQSSLTLNADATYTYTARAQGSQAQTDKVVANGVTINGATFSFLATVRGTLAAGTAFTVINNTAATAISGIFSNLPDGSTIAVGRNTFQASYEGGDGNDLTLTVQ